MTHFIIKLVGMSLSSGIRKAGDFLFSEKHKALIYQGREIPLSEHNALVPAVMEKYNGYRPRLPQVVLLDLSNEPAPVPKVRPAAIPSSEPVAEPLVSEGVSQEESSGEETEAPGEAILAEPEAEVPTEPIAPVPPKKKAPAKKPKS